MRAKNLPEVWRVLDLQSPLTGKELDEFYAERISPVEGMIELLSEEKPVKLLFSGYRGTGKTTELNRLAKEIKDSLFPIIFRSKRI